MTKSEKIKSDTPLTGTIVSLPSPQISELLSAAGFDWLMLDMEHSVMDLATIQAHLQAMHPDCVSIVRIPSNDPEWIKRVLETGCDGIMVPMVNSAEEARTVIQAAKYPPLGSRSIGAGRAHGYGKTFEEYIQRANEDTVVLVQAEHIEAVNNIQEIAQVKGIGGIFIGPYDLSGSMGLIGQVTHPDVLGAIGRVKEHCLESGMPYGLFGMDPAAMKAEAGAGCKYVLVNTDLGMLARSADWVVGEME